MTILAPHTASQVRNAALSALHFIAYEHQCEVSDILALVSGPFASISGPDAEKASVVLSTTDTPSQPSPASQAPAARTSDQPSSDMQAEDAAPQTSADPSNGGAQC